MVVPIERASSSTKSAKKYIGNNQDISLKENYSTVKVIGNDCAIRIEKNEGCLKVIGDSCEITVCAGSGSLNYIGNYGKVTLGEDVDESGINYTGNGVRIVKIAANREEGEVIIAETSKRRLLKKASRNCVNLRNKRSLHIGHCQNIFVPLCHDHICVRIPDLDTTKKS